MLEICNQLWEYLVISLGEECAIIIAFILSYSVYSVEIILLCRFLDGVLKRNMVNK